MEENKNITKEEVIKDLEKTYLIQEDEEKYIKSTTLPKDLARLVFAAYIQGTKRFLNSYIEMNQRCQMLQEKYQKFAVKMADRMIGED